MFNKTKEKLETNKQKKTNANEITKHEDSKNEDSEVKEDMEFELTMKQSI